ncbi:MAG: KAP family NTPase [Bacteroides sp.]|nr:KAP family NTPase [Bacteroides sp.]MCM1388722.1 KAP family NTPase [Bacteroides sp.]
MKQTGKTSLSDMPFKEMENDFGTERYVNGLIKFIENSSAPITIALQGEWGSGKTSMMTRLERSLCIGDNAPFIGVSINTWEYSMMSSPEITVYKIMAQLVRELTGGDIDSKKKVSKILKGLYRGGREALKMIPGINVAVEMANMPTDISIDENDISLTELRDELQKAIQNRISEKNKRGVIVFVDDLDRLNPPVAVEILELLKNVFTLDNCIFVLAIDYDVVVKGLEPKFGKLTDKNEREFRSFFDKIIQVPFSLPVSSYRPMDFVLKALVDIGYLNDFDASDPNVITRFSAVVESSVGKNPRSIKRLINTLSLLDCIAQCGASQKEVPTIDEKLLNFIVVAIQICYPQIYRLLVHRPAFMLWDKAFAHKEGISVNADNPEFKEWDDVLEAACATDKYLTQHMPDIMSLFLMIIKIMGQSNESNPETIGLKLKQVLDKSSVTGVNASFKAEDFDQKDLIYKLYDNMIKRLNALRPDITLYKLKRNTGNGGIYMWIDDDTSFDITFTPSINSNNEISLKLWMDFHIARPERMTNMSFDEIMTDERLASSLAGFDSVLTPLLESEYYLKGRTYDGYSSYFTSFTDELRYIHKMGWMSGDITNNPEYWIELKKPSHFEERKVIDTITNLLIANYDFRKSMKDWQ